MENGLSWLESPNTFDLIITASCLQPLLALTDMNENILCLGGPAGSVRTTGLARGSSTINDCPPHGLLAPGPP